MWTVIAIGVFVFVLGVAALVVTEISKNTFDQMNDLHEDVEKYCEELK